VGQTAAVLRRSPLRSLTESRTSGLGGGAGGIRTHDTLLTYTHFPGVRLRPLGHRSVCLFGQARAPSRRGLPRQASRTTQRAMTRTIGQAPSAAEIEALARAALD